MMLWGIDMGEFTPASIVLGAGILVVLYFVTKAVFD